MKKEALAIIVGLVFLVGGYVLGTFVPLNAITGNASLNSDLDTFAYGVGIDMGISIMEFAEQNDIAADFSDEKFITGIQAGLDNNEEVMTRMEAQQSVQAFVMSKQQAMQMKAQTDAQEVLADGLAFLEENKTKPGVLTTESGLQYEIMEEGTGVSPLATDTVKVDYVGTLIDGTEFDSSIETGEPAKFAVNGVIPGWTEALQLMKEGSKWRLFIPSELAYGPRQRSEVIKANSTLIFEVELIDIIGK